MSVRWGENGVARAQRISAVPPDGLALASTLFDIVCGIGGPTPRSAEIS